jgi:alkylated DNA repair dioxygenase AlkB
MDLFSDLISSNSNLLPYDGIVHYHGRIFSPAEANHYQNALRTTIEWKPDEALIFGKRIQTRREVAWYGNEAFRYTYSKTSKVALPWTPELLELKQIVEEQSGEHFNSCLLNLYHDGSEGMAWHRDEEIALKKNGAIASLSFGAERKFAFKHRFKKEKLALQLEHGSLLIMKGSTQSNWLHSLPPSKKVHRERINLTFRTIAQQ